jgi:hypothetical protein
MARYITFPVQINPSVLLGRAYSYLKARMPGWSEIEGELDVWLLEAVSSELSELLDVASRVPDTIFRSLGRSILGIQPIDPASATTTTTWVLNDTTGYTIPALTQVGVRDAAGLLVPFLTVNDVIVPPGSNTTAAGEIAIVALAPGADATGLGTVGGAVELIDILDFVASITMVTPTSGGADGESDATYMNRLTTDVRLLSKTPILPQDFADLSLDIAGVYRAVALDGYNPGDDTFNNERMVTVAAIDVAGEDVSSPIKAAIDAYLESLREVNFIVNEMSPTYNLIDVTAAAKALPGFSTSDVQTNIESTLTRMFDPANFGQPTPGTDQAGDPRAWVNNTIVRLYDVTHAIKLTDGVDYVASGGITIGKNGGAQAAADLTLTGRVPLTRAGTFAITVT